MKNPAPPKLEKFPAAKQRRMDQLLEKNREGTIKPREKARLEQLVAEAERLMIANSQRLADFAQGDGPPAPEGAVPVTVWVQAEHTQR
jgi:hypothetical protein